MTRAVAALALALGACAPGHPCGVRWVHVVDERLDGPVEAALDAWTEAGGPPMAIGHESLATVVVTGSRSLATDPRGPLVGLAHVYPGDPFCWIEISPDAPDSTIVEIVAHEIGHCLGLGHDKKPDSVMARVPLPGVRILPGHARATLEACR